MKSIKQIVSAFNKTLTTRQASRKAQNERRKLQRRLAKELTSELGEKISWKQATEIYEGSKVESKLASEIYSDITKLRSQKIEGTNKRVGYSVELSEIAEKIERRYPTEQTLKRRNKIFTNELNQATKKDSISELDKNEVHAFYTVTYELWKGVSVEQDRNKTIMNVFGVNELKTVYDLIQSKELNAEDFGFEDEETFNEWLEDIKSRVDLDEMRRIYHEELSGANDIPEAKYKTNVMQNIKIRAADVRFRR